MQKSGSENADLELVAGLWIIAKATNVFSSSTDRAKAWYDFSSEAELITRRYGYSQEEFGTKLRKTAERLYANQLKNEIFGYAKSEVAA